MLSIPTNSFVEKVVWGITRLRKDSATIVLGLLRPVSDCWMAISWLIISLSIRTCHWIGSGGQGGGVMTLGDSWWCCGSGGWVWLLVTEGCGTISYLSRENGMCMWITKQQFFYIASGTTYSRCIPVSIV